MTAVPMAVLTAGPMAGRDPRERLPRRARTVVLTVAQMAVQMVVLMVARTAVPTAVLMVARTAGRTAVPTELLAADARS